MNFQEIKQQDLDYIMHTYGRVDVALVKGKNATAWDVDGKEYIDFTSGIAVNPLGYADEAWADAVSAQAHTMQHMCNYYYNPVNIKLAKELALASGLSKSFFSNSGAEANECAIKVARKHGEEKKAWQIITLHNSFHGRTLTTLAACGQDVFHALFQPLTPGFLYADPTMESIEAVYDDTVCAVMIEMVQGEGGIIPMDEDFVKALRVFCDEKGILLIADEVQTGIGRTGSFFGYQSYGVMPDIATCAKGLAGGLPIGVCMVSEALSGMLQPGMQGSTFGGNPVVCAGALEVMRRVNNEHFMREVTGKSVYFKQALENLPQVEATRGRGLMIGIKMKELNAHDVLLECAKAGLLVLTAKEMVRFLPPLTITQEEIDKGLQIFDKVTANM